jgi:hypothetical protein
MKKLNNDADDTGGTKNFVKLIKYIFKAIKLMHQAGDFFMILYTI